MPSLKGKPAPVIDGLTGDQRFFLAFAQTWKQKQRPEAAKQQVASDPHTPSEFRGDRPAAQCRRVVRRVRRQGRQRQICAGTRTARDAFW